MHFVVCLSSLLSRQFHCYCSASCCSYFSEKAQQNKQYVDSEHQTTDRQSWRLPVQHTDALLDFQWPGDQNMWLSMGWLSWPSKPWIIYWSLFCYCCVRLCFVWAYKQYSGEQFECLWMQWFNQYCYSPLMQNQTYIIQSTITISPVWSRTSVLPSVNSSNNLWFVGGKFSLKSSGKRTEWKSRGHRLVNEAILLIDLGAKLH